MNRCKMSQKPIKWLIGTHETKLRWNLVCTVKKWTTFWSKTFDPHSELVGMSVIFFMGILSSRNQASLYIKGQMNKFGYLYILYSIMLHYADGSNLLYWIIQHGNVPKHTAGAIRNGFEGLKLSRSCNVLPIVEI